MLLIAGTTKGLIQLKQRDSDWEVTSVHFKGLPVSMVHYCAVSATWWVGLSIKHWGPKLFSSKDGQHWHECRAPGYPPDVVLKDGKPATLKLIWSGLYQPHRDRLWLGTEPGGLFYSDDQGATFTLCRSLWDHPSRKQHWFGGGRNDAGIHSILAHPHKPEEIWIGVSCGGVFMSRDGGLTWEGRNEGLRADYLPDPHAEFGHDPHAMAICQDHPQVIWQQNHCGVFRSEDYGQHWQDVTAADGYGRYGFPLVIDPSDPRRAWIIPAESDEQRVAKNEKLTVVTTEDGGQTWQHQTNGLPQEGCFDLVFRHAFARMGSQMAFGTTTGNLFASADLGGHWSLVSRFLPPIHVVAFIPEN